MGIYEQFPCLYRLVYRLPLAGSIEVNEYRVFLRAAQIRNLAEKLRRVAFQNIVKKMLPPGTLVFRPRSAACQYVLQ